MGNLFGRSKAHRQSPSSAPQISEQDRAILELKRQKDRLHQYTLALELIIQKETEGAKQLLKQNKKDRAVLALKRRRYQQSLCVSTEAQISNLEQLCSSIEFAVVSARVFEALKLGNATLQRLNAETRLEDVERLMDDTHEALEYQQHINTLLGGELTAVDEQEVEEELNQMEAETMKDDVTYIAASMPQVPNHRSIIDNKTADKGAIKEHQTRPVSTRPKQDKDRIVLSS